MTEKKHAPAGPEEPHESQGLVGSEPEHEQNEPNFAPVSPSIAATTVPQPQDPTLPAPFTTLPQVLLERILSFMTPRDVYTVALVCARFRFTGRSDELWRRFGQRDYRPGSVAAMMTLRMAPTWRQGYQETYASQEGFGAHWEAVLPMRYRPAKLGFIESKKVGAKAEVSVAMFGGEGAGKTEIVDALRQVRRPFVEPTVGFNLESFVHRQYQWNLWDVGAGLYDMWRLQFKGQNALIYVCDLSNRDRWFSAQYEGVHGYTHSDSVAIGHIVDDPDCPPELPLVVFANKADLAPATDLVELAIRLGLFHIQRRPWYILPCTALGGAAADERANLLRGFDVLADFFGRQQHQAAPQQAPSPAAPGSVAPAARSPSGGLVQLGLGLSPYRSQTQPRAPSSLQHQEGPELDDQDSDQGLGPDDGPAAGTDRPSAEPPMHL
nr:ArlX5 [Paratrimastix pyriformis]